MVIILSVRNLEHYLTRTRRFQINRDSKRLKMNQTAQMGGGRVQGGGDWDGNCTKIGNHLQPCQIFYRNVFFVIYILGFRNA